MEHLQFRTRYEWTNVGQLLMSRRNQRDKPTTQGLDLNEQLQKQLRSIFLKTMGEINIFVPGTVYKQRWDSQRLRTPLRVAGGGSLASRYPTWHCV